MLKLLGKDVAVSGSCNQCGSCCSRLNLNRNGTWLTLEDQFKKLVGDDPDYERFHVIGRSDNGLLEFACSWLQEDGTCRDHENRLDICREYPKKNMFFMNGELPTGCGYSMEVGTPFKKLLKRSIKAARKR